ncbi:MAG TPA: putative urea ABC transporter substrate-binding protein [Gammaproteobacteria bacterium]|nr:putative urea ABC transporter substrate-binding protein [Gammaproteobacteria bacterium]
MQGFLKRYFAAAALGLAVIATAAIQPAAAAGRTHFKLAWSIYAGWMPWGYAADHGIIKKWAKKYGITIDVTQVNDYIQSINQYTSGDYDACLMTNMDALTIPAAAGVDSTALIVGDFSNGNDGVVLKGKGKTFADIKGQKVNIVELSVSQYLLDRALQMHHMSERDLTLVNTSDADMVAAYQAPSTTAVVTWKPQLSTILASPDATEVFNSSRIPGEIIDMAVIKTDVLKKYPKFAKALVGAWYETMKLMTAKNAAAKAALTSMAKASGTDLKGYESQLATTRMFYKPSAAVKFTDSPKLLKTMDYVRQFSFQHGLLGQGAESVNAVGIQFPDGKVLGDKSNIKLRFNSRYMKMAADGKL